MHICNIYTNRSYRRKKKNVLYFDESPVSSVCLSSKVHLLYLCIFVHVQIQCTCILYFCNYFFCFFENEGKQKKNQDTVGRLVSQSRNIFLLYNTHHIQHNHVSMLYLFKPSFTRSSPFGLLQCNMLWHLHWSLVDANNTLSCMWFHASSSDVF